MRFAIRRPPAGVLLLSCALLACVPSGCSSGKGPRVLSAELIDGGGADGAVRPGGRILITLDRPAADLHLDAVQVWSGPPRTRLLARVHAGPAPNAIEVELLSTPPPLTSSGRFQGDGGPNGATGIGVDLGSGGAGEQWVDLQERRPFPALVRAIWEDRPTADAPGGDLVVDQGDWIRLLFDRDVRLAVAGKAEAAAGGGAAPVEARVPADVLLASPDDRLDDGTVRSTFLEGPGPREVRIVLGSSPRLTIAGRHRGAAARSPRARAASLRSSEIALNGTVLQPLEKIVDRRGWPGAVSRRPVDIEYPPGYVFFEKQVEEPFPPPGHRMFHTVTPIAGGRAVIAGGRSWAGDPLGQVLLFSPEASQPLTVQGHFLGPRYLHTATLIPGKDPLNDTVVIAGGTDRNGSLAVLAAIRLDPISTEKLIVEPLDVSLRTGRTYHTATFIPPNLLLIDGGRHSAPSGGGGILRTAEILAFEWRQGKAVVRQRWEVPTLPRMRHTSTYLGRGADGAHYVLHYGGFGIPRELETRGDAAGAEAGGNATPPPLNPEEGLVLAAPELLRVRTHEREGAAAHGEPQVERIPLDWRFRWEMLRYDHAAAPVAFDPLTVAGDSPREVLIAGGTLKPPNYDAALPDRNHYEPPGKADLQKHPEDADRYARKPPFTEGSSESAAAVVFEFRPDAPEQSGFHIVESPTGEQRVHASLVGLPFPGVLVLGGENPQHPEEMLLTAEVYLAGEKRLAPLAVPLAAPRTRLGAYGTLEVGSFSVYAVGGLTTDEEKGGFADVERMRMEWK